MVKIGSQRRNLIWGLPDSTQSSFICFLILIFLKFCVHWGRGGITELSLGVGSLFPPWFQGMHLGCQPWQQVPYARRHRAGPFLFS